MKILFCFVLLSFFPLWGETQKDKEAPSEQDTTLTPFVPLLPDSLYKDSLRVWISPEIRPEFQYRMGILEGPDPYTVELNPGGIYKVDPTVDLGMIYPLQTRQKILLEKSEKNKALKKPDGKPPDEPKKKLYLFRKKK